MRRLTRFSDGQRGMVALLADIARRMCLLNPQLGDAVLSDTPGVVLIDELVCTCTWPGNAACRGC